MKKRWMAALLTFVLAFCLTGFAGCGGDDDGPQDTADVKVVKVWLHKSDAEPEGRVYRTLAEMFNEQKLTTRDGRTIMMSLEFKNSAETLSQAISSEIIGGGLPDIVAVDSPHITAYAQQEILQPLDEYITDGEKASYVDSVITQSTYRNGLYALSGMDAPAGLYYNKELLKSVGYTDAQFGTIENPWSWKDVQTAMKALKAQNKAYKIKLNLGFGGNEGSMYLYSSLVYSAGGQFVTSAGKAVGALTGEKALAGMGMIADLFAQDATEEWVYNGNNENAFPGGEVAFEIYGPWLIDTINKDYRNFADKYDVMPFPVYEAADGTKGTIATPCGSWSFGVTTQTRDAYASARVVAFLTGPEASRLMYESIGTYPTHKSVLGDAEHFGAGAAKSLSDLLLTTAMPRPCIENYPKLTDEYASIINYIKTKAGASDYNLASYVSDKANAIDK